MNKLDLYLLGPKGDYVLRRLYEALGSDAVSSVISARDKGVVDDCFDAIKECAESYKIPFRHRSDKAEASAKFALAVGWRWLIGEDYEKVIVLHDSLLPRYRGFNPLVSCLLNAESEIGVTALIASAEYDRGPIIGQKRIPVSYPLTIAAAIDALLPLYGDLAIDATRAIGKGELGDGQVQDEAKATYSLWRDDEDYWIDWTLDAAYLQRFVMAVGHPYAGARTRAHGRRLVIDNAEMVEDVHIENRAPGKVIFLKDGQPVIACGTGLLRILSGHYEDEGTPLIPFTRMRTRFGDGRILS